MKLCFALALLVSCLSSAFAQTGLPLENPGFEEGLTGWVVKEKTPMSEVAGEAAREGGKMGLRVKDEDDVNGSSVSSAAIPVQPGKSYGLTFWARTASPNAAAVLLWFYGSDHRLLSDQDARNYGCVVLAGGDEWREHSKTVVAPESAVSMAIWIHTFSTAKGTVDFDDFKLEEAP